MHQLNLGSLMKFLISKKEIMKLDLQWREIKHTRQNYLLVSSLKQQINIQIELIGKAEMKTTL